MTTGSPALLTIEARYGGDKYNKSLSEIEANMLNSQRLLLASLYTAAESVDPETGELLPMSSAVGQTSYDYSERYPDDKDNPAFQMKKKKMRLKKKLVI